MGESSHLREALSVITGRAFIGKQAERRLHCEIDLGARVLQDHCTCADHVDVGFGADAAHFIADKKPDVVVDHAPEFFSGPLLGSEFRSCGSLRMSLT